MARARETLLEAFAAYTISLHLTSGIQPGEIAEVARSTSAQHGSSATLEDHLLAGTAHLVAEGPETAFSHYRQAADVLSEGDISNDQIAKWFVLGLVVANERLDDRAHRAWAQRTDKSARENGALLVLLFNLFGLADVDVRSGDLESAGARFEEAQDVAAAIGMPAEFYPPMGVEVQAWAGNENLTREYAGSLIELNLAIGTAVPVLQAYHTLATMHLGAGRYSEALEATSYVHTTNPLGWTSQTLPLAIEAAVRSDERELAESLLHRLGIRAKASATPWALGLFAQSTALLSGGEQAESSFETAIALLGKTLVSRDCAYARLLYGEWLRRENRRLDAREHLRKSHEYFLSMGANAFAKRAETELLATGEKARSRNAVQRSELTPQERRIAQLAAERLTNPEIAAKLFISSATVDYHLRKVFRKLGIASRRQLSDVLHSKSPA